MNVRVTVALLVIAAALGGYVWWVEVPRAEREEEAKASEARVLALDLAAVTRLELPLAGGSVARLTLGDEGWRLEAPVETRADAGAVEGLLHALDELERASRVAELPDDLAPFGLLPRTRVVRIWSGDGDPLELVLGGSAPIGTTRYLLRDGEQPALFTAEAAQLERLEPQLDTLRDKSLVRLDPDAVDALRVESAGELLVAAVREPIESDVADPDALADPLLVEESDWRIVEPLEAPADPERILRLLQDVRFARAIAFFDDGVDPEKTGLASPDVAVELRAGETVERLELARATSDTDKVFARVAGRPIVYEVPERLLTAVPRQLFAYRWKRVLSLDSDRVRALELRFPRSSAVYTFAKGEDGAWTPEATDVPVDPYRIEDILYALRALDASALEEGSPDPGALGLEPALVRISARDPDGEELGWLELGDPDGANGLPARSSQDPRIWRVRDELGQDIPLGLAAFEARWLQEGDPDAAPPPVGDAG